MVTAVCLFFLKREFRAYIQVRQRYLQQRKPHMRTIMLDVPADARSNAILESYFGYLYPDSVLSAVCTQVGASLPLKSVLCLSLFSCVFRLAVLACLRCPKKCHCCLSPPPPVSLSFHFSSLLFISPFLSRSSLPLSLSFSLPPL